MSKGTELQKPTAADRRSGAADRTSPSLRERSQDRLDTAAAGMKCTYCSGLCEPDPACRPRGTGGPVENAPGVLLGLASLPPAGPGSLVTTSTAPTDRNDDQVSPRAGLA